MIRRSPRLHGPIGPRMRAALYYARKKRLARLLGDDGGGQPDPGGSGLTMPAGVPQPDLWYSAEDAVINETDGFVDFIPNRGAAGSDHDATRQAASRELLVEESADWNGKKIFSYPGTSNGFDIANELAVRSFASMVNYRDGFATFSGYPGLFSGPGSIGDDFQFVGYNGRDTVFDDFDFWYKDGVLLPGTDPDILPMPKNALGVMIHEDAAADGSAPVKVLFRDNFDEDRCWEGETGDLLFWVDQLTDTQMKDVHAALIAYYGS